MYYEIHLFSRHRKAAFCVIGIDEPTARDAETKAYTYQGILHAHSYVVMDDTIIDDASREAMLPPAPTPTLGTLP